MRNRPEEKECITNKSAFDYTLVLKPDGTVIIQDECGKPVEHKETSEMPPIKSIVNTRTLTILEAEGSKWLYIVPPGTWIRLSY